MDIYWFKHLPSKHLQVWEQVLILLPQAVYLSAKPLLNALRGLKVAPQATYVAVSQFTSLQSEPEITQTKKGIPWPPKEDVPSKVIIIRSEIMN